MNFCIIAKFTKQRLHKMCTKKSSPCVYGYSDYTYVKVNSESKAFCTLNIYDSWDCYKTDLQKTIKLSFFLAMNVYSPNLVYVNSSIYFCLIVFYIVLSTCYYRGVCDKFWLHFHDIISDLKEVGIWNALMQLTISRNLIPW